MIRLQTGFPGGAAQAAFSPDDATLAVSGDGDALRFFDARSGRSLGPVLRIGAKMQELEFARGSNRLVVRTDQGMVLELDPANPRECDELRHGGSVAGMRLTDDGETLFVWGGARFQAWRVETASALYAPAQFPEPIAETAFFDAAPDLVFLWSRAGRVGVYSVQTGEPEARLYEHGPGLAGLTASAQRLLTWDDSGLVREC